MSKHTWVLEHIASYLAGGLDADERERLRDHTAGCADCAQALKEAQAMDTALENLFVASRPSATMEDRLIQRLRNSRPASSPLKYWIPRIVAAVAAVIMVALLGASLSYHLEQGEFPFLGESSGTFASSPQTIPASAMEWYGDLSTDGQKIVALADASKSMDAEVDKLAPELLDSLGYYPPSSGLSVKGTSRIHTNVDDLADKLKKEVLGDLESSGVPATALAGKDTMLRYRAKERTEGRSAGAAEGKPIDSRSALQLGEGEVDRKEPQDISKLNSNAPAGSSEPALNKKSHDLPVKAPSPQVTNGTMLPRATYGASPVPDAGRQLTVDGLQAQTAGKDGKGNFTYYYSTLDFSPPKPAVDAKGQSAPATGAQFGFGVMPASPAAPTNPTTNPIVSFAADAEAKNKVDKAAGYTRLSEVLLGKPVQPELKMIEDRTLRERVEAKVQKEELTDLQVQVAKGKEGEVIAGQAVQPAQRAAAANKIIIRTGDIEFEIVSFDGSVAAITQLINNVPGAFVATTNSQKLPNGKVRGSVVVRMPPEKLDNFVLDLRKELGKAGELKTQRIGSQDITKQYTDLESRLRAARTMEERLLVIIKTGKGEIKDLLQAERELGVWRTKIEEMEGELRYFNNQVSLSTLTITLYEKEIRSAAVINETERVNMGIEVEDVDKSQQATLAVVTAAKGRVTKSELKQHAAGQFSAQIHFEVAPDSSGQVRDRLRQLGNVARLEIDRLQQAEDGTGQPTDAKTRRKDSQYFVSLYNLANIAPRETVTITLANADAEAAYRSILTRVQKTAGRILTSNINRQRNDQTVGTIQFEVPTADADNILRELKDAGEVLKIQSTENPDAQNVTKSKRGFTVQVLAMGLVVPRETAVIQVASKDVPAGYRSLRDALAKAKSRVLNAQLNEQDKQNITATLDFEIVRADEAAMEAALAQIGDAYSRNVTRAQDGENVLDSKIRMQVTLVNQSHIPPRENILLGIEVGQVDATVTLLTSLARQAQGRVVASQVTHESSGQATAKLTLDVPLAAAADLVEKTKQTGTVRVQQALRNNQAPEGPLAIARLEITLSDRLLIVPKDEGIWTQVRKGLAYSFQGLSFSLTFLIIGVLFLLPWALLIYVVYRIVKRLRRSSPVAG